MKKVFFLLFALWQVAICQAKLYDCFTFFNEIELLLIRLDELDDVVDHFVIVEAVKTFSGEDKPLYFAENEALFQKYRNKIIHIVVDSVPFPQGNCSELNWPRQEYQRNAILWGLTNCKDDDIIMISDVDEIPNLEAIAAIKKYFSEHDITTVNNDEHKLICELHMRLLMLYLNWEDVQGWAGAVKAAPYWITKKILPHSLRLLHNYDRNLPKIYNAGWHFHSMGGRDRVTYKLESVSTAYIGHSYEEYVAWVKEVYSPIVVPIGDDFPKYILNHFAFFDSAGWLLHEQEK